MDQKSQFEVSCTTKEPPTHTQSETFPIHHAQSISNSIPKSHSSSILSSSNKFSFEPLTQKIQSHSKSQDSLIIEKKRNSNISSSDTNPYAIKDIHPSFKKNINIDHQRNQASRHLPLPFDQNYYKKMNWKSRLSLINELDLKM